MYLGKNSRLNDGKNVWVFLVVLLAGIVLGGFLGELLNLLADAAGWLGFLRWFNYGFNFGFASPMMIDLGIITLTFGFTVKFTICGLLGLFVAVISYRKI